ncbi:ABC transporter permease [Tistrella bauzanensis]|uniref:ABC transporter permease n=1 Tax=Tistrella arctica TaxID=3133430 RepID=A0ABU9YQ97_9PROT
MSAFVKRAGAGGVLGASIALLLVLVWIAGPWLAPYDPMAIDIGARLVAFTAAHPLGADDFGRDILSRLIHGARASATIAFATVVVAVTLGLIFGVLAGYLRGWAERVIMVVTDSLLAFPGLLLALGIMTVTRAGETAMIVALGLAYAPAVIRVTRSTVLSVRQREFVEASRVMGNPERITMWRHVLPNCIAPMTVLATTMFGWVILAESALSFLGLGVPPPQPTWGNMLAAARPYITQAPWLIILPGLCISLTLLGANLLGDALRDLTDPRMRR